ncbi:MAG: hypothetical protein LCH96_03365 [Actinobacteria bacterium]|nr:hypothetical protein [Actinomycetota bacterium]
MGRRRAHAQARPAAEAAVDMPVSARVAWSYTAIVVATAATGFLVVLFNQTVAVMVCAAAGKDTDAFAECKLGVALWVALLGFVLCLLPAVLMLKLGWWLWAAMAAAAGLLVATDAMTEWWWWAVAALVPAAAALASADWGRGRVFRRWQLGIILALDAAAAATLVWWYLKG